MGAKICYLNTSGDEVATAMNEMPQSCGDCPLHSSRETYSHYDDLEGFDVYDEEIVCTATATTVNAFRAEGSLRYDYGQEERTLSRKPTDCPLYEE